MGTLHKLLSPFAHDLNRRVLGEIRVSRHDSSDLLRCQTLKLGPHCGVDYCFPVSLRTGLRAERSGDEFTGTAQTTTDAAASKEAKRSLFEHVSGVDIRPGHHARVSVLNSRLDCFGTTFEKRGLTDTPKCSLSRGTKNTPQTEGVERSNCDCTGGYFSQISAANILTPLKLRSVAPLPPKVCG